MKNVAVEHNHPSMTDMLSLQGKGAVVTGGAQGIGAEIALRLSEAGAEVALLDINARQAEHTAREISAESGNHVFFHHVDVAEPDDVFRAARWAGANLPSLDIWINNAGIFPHEDPARVNPQDFARVLDVNLLGAQIGCEAAVEMMREQEGGGVILNIASSPAFHPAGSYAASKWALQGLTRGLAGYLGGEGIRVLCVAPTLIDTPGLQRLQTEEAEATHKLRKTLPLKKRGRADDVARAVSFLVSPAADWITGVTLPVDGGESAVPGARWGNGAV